MTKKRRSNKPPSSSPTSETPEEGQRLQALLTDFFSRTLNKLRTLQRRDRIQLLPLLTSNQQSHSKTSTATSQPSTPNSTSFNTIRSTVPHLTNQGIALCGCGWPDLNKMKDLYQKKISSDRDARNIERNTRTTSQLSKMNSAKQLNKEDEKPSAKNNLRSKLSYAFSLPLIAIITFLEALMYLPTWKQARGGHTT